MRSLAYGVLSTKLLSFKRMGVAGIGAQYSWPGILRVDLLNHVLAIINSAVMNIGVHVSLSFLVS